MKYVFFFFIYIEQTDTYKQLLLLIVRGSTFWLSKLLCGRMAYVDPLQIH